MRFSYFEEIRRPVCGAARAGRIAVRRGITLLEVLVAMLVLTVGVLGMAAIIPLGKLELAEGDISDNSATVGRWAFREISVIRSSVSPSANCSWSASPPMLVKGRMAIDGLSGKGSCFRTGSASP